MKLSKIFLITLSSSSILATNYFISNKASAQCVQADVAVQYNISGSKQPTVRSNDVEMQSNGRCQGNVSVTTGVQGNVGGRNPVTQSRKVRNRISGEGQDRGMKPVQIKTGVEVDVYNPADNFDY